MCRRQTLATTRTTTATTEVVAAAAAAAATAANRFYLIILYMSMCMNMGMANYVKLPTPGNDASSTLNMQHLSRSQLLMHVPFFGGGVRNLLRYIRPHTHYGRKSDYRSDFDENYMNYHGAQLWKLNFNATRKPTHEKPTGGQLQEFVEQFGSEVWNINQDGIDILIDYKNTGKAKEFMSKADFSYNIMIDDIETAIDETYTEVNNSNTQEQQQQQQPWLIREGTLLNWQRYHDYGDIQQFLQHILEHYADITEIIQIGITSNKRPLEVLRISNGDTRNWAIFVNAGMQARDWLSPAAVTYAISKLVWLWSQPPDDGSQDIMRNIDWYFLPVANPDGYQYSRLIDRLWTKNRFYDAQTGCYGVNLERNFEYAWGQAGSSLNPCKNLYRGTKKFSEPETRAIRTFLLNMKDYLGAYVGFSAYGQAITYPWGDADYFTENRRELHKLARKAMLNLRRLNQAEYTVGSSYRLKLARSGNAADWVQERLNTQYVYNVFLKDQGRYGYLMPPHYIIESGEEAYEFMRTIAKALG